MDLNEHLRRINLKRWQKATPESRRALGVKLAQKREAWRLASMCAEEQEAYFKRKRARRKSA